MDTWDIGIDLDGVMYPFDQQIAEEARLAGVGRVPARPVARTWHFYRAWGITDQEFLDLYRDGVLAHRLLWHGDPYPGTHDGWAALKQAGHRLHVITDRRPPGAEPDARDATYSWLDAHGIDPDTVTISPDKTGILEMAEHPDRVAFIDDRTENHQALLGAGIRAFLMQRPWNTDAPGPRVRSLLEFATMINSLAVRT